jgi:hypothetical protein
MEAIYKTIQNYNKVNVKITNQTYARRIAKLQEMNQDVNNYEKTIQYIKQNYKEKTYKSFITSIVVYLKATGGIVLAEKYGKEMKRVNDIIQTKEKDNLPTSSEKQNFVTQEEIKSLIDQTVLKMKNENNTSSDKFDLIKQHLVLNLYYLIPPLRNDYVGCMVVETLPFFIDTTKNYIILSQKKLLLNRYKTQKHYGNKEIELSDQLLDIVKEYMVTRTRLYSELINNNELLLTKYLKPMNQVNLTQFLNKIFKKKVSSTMLRKSYISSKYESEHSVNQMEADARTMGHSVGTQQSTYRKMI